MKSCVSCDFLVWFVTKKEVYNYNQASDHLKWWYFSYLNIYSPTAKSSRTHTGAFCYYPKKRVDAVKIPKDISIGAYIRGLIKAGKIEQFYFTEDWKELREEVQEFFHFECQECLKQGRYTRADCVHHVNEVRQRPDLALSRYFTDQEGQQQYNLITLCNTCHNLIHDKLGEWQKKDKYINEERW